MIECELYFSRLQCAFGPEMGYLLMELNTRDEGGSLRVLKFSKEGLVM